MKFHVVSRWLHWLMAAMIIAMLFIGAGMAASVSPRYTLLVAIHRPLGISILILVVIRLVNRWITPPPKLPASLPTPLRFAAEASQILLYGLMVAMPVVGWAMLSAERVPIELIGPLRLPPILPENAAVYGWLRPLHTDLAYLLFATFLAHLGGALFHGLIRRDGVFESMASLTIDRPPMRRD
jgi:cytochrome b561